MPTKTYLTVKELAELQGVSKQAIYKRMNTDLSTYVVKVENQKCLDYKVLRLFSDNQFNQKVERSTEVETLKKLVEILEKENDIKQQTIERLQEKNDEQHQKLMELTGQVGNTLQALTQTQLADKLIEGKQLVAAGADPTDPVMTPEKKPGFFSRYFRSKTL